MAQPANSEGHRTRLRQHFRSAADTLLLDDASVAAARQDVDIQRGLVRLLEFNKEQVKPIQALRSGLEALFQEIGQRPTR